MSSARVWTVGSADVTYDYKHGIMQVKQHTIKFASFTIPIKKKKAKRGKSWDIEEGVRLCLCYPHYWLTDYQKLFLKPFHSHKKLTISLQTKVKIDRIRADGMKFNTVNIQNR